MMGVGPGALPTDATMIGIDPLEQRAALEEDFEVLMHLLLKDEPISIQTKAVSAGRRAFAISALH